MTIRLKGSKMFKVSSFIENKNIKINVIREV